MRRLNPEQRKLALSLVVNFATRVPGAFGLLLILPLLRFDLGTSKYAFLLGALALGSTATFLFGGFNTMGRRIMGEAYAKADPLAEASGFRSMLMVNSVVFAGILCLIAIYSLTQQFSLNLFLIAGFVALAALLNSFDNARAAYNEHYVTASLQIAIQVANFGLAFYLPVFRNNPLLACYVIQGHTVLASLIAGIMLIAQKPYLLKGDFSKVTQIASSGFTFGLADGLLSAALSLSVVWVQATAAPDTAGWYATLLRLFQTILVPVILLLMPLSSYIRLIWERKSARDRSNIILVTAFVGLGYGAMSSLGLALASVIYIERLLKFPPPSDWFDVFAIYTMFVAIIGYRSYSSIAYLVINGNWLAKCISYGVMSVIAFCSILAIWLPPISVIGIYAVSVAALLIVCEIMSAVRFRKMHLGQTST